MAMLVQGAAASAAAAAAAAAAERDDPFDGALQPHDDGRGATYYQERVGLCRVAWGRVGSGGTHKLVDVGSCGVVWGRVGPCGGAIWVAVGVVMWGGHVGWVMAWSSGSQ